MTDERWLVTRPGERIVVALAAAGVAAGFLVNARWLAALGAARNDDWAYLRVTERFVSEGEMRFDGWTQMSFVGQAVLSWPVGTLFGSSIAGYQMLVASLGAVGLIALWWTLREWLSRRRAALAMVVVVAGPLYGSLATSYMTDAPAFAATSLCVFASVRTSRSFSAGWLVVLCVSGVLSVSIREYGAVALVVGLLVALRAEDQASRRLVCVGVVTAAVACVAVLSWRRTVDGGGPPIRAVVGTETLVGGVDNIARGAFTLALLVAPVAFLAVGQSGVVPRGLGQANDARRGPVLLAVVAWACVLWRSELTFVGNYVNATGSYTPLISGDLPVVLPVWLHSAARAVAAAALLILSVVVACRLGRTSVWRAFFVAPTRWRILPADPRGVVATTLAGTLGLHALLCLVTNAPFFDRYLLGPSAWAAGLMVDGRMPRPDIARVTRVVVALGSATLFLVSGRLVGAAAGLDGGAWRFAEQLADDVDRRSIDGGFAWFGYHQTGPVHTESVAERTWWTSFYPDQPICVTVQVVPGNGPGPALGLLGPRYDFVAVWHGDPDCEGETP